MNRRHFAYLSALSMTQLMLRRVSPAQAAGSVRVSVDIAKESKTEVPADFTGLSYEMPQLYNPHFFSATNAALIQAYRELSPAGVLRLGAT